MGNLLTAFARSVRADYGSLQRYRGKYHQEKVSAARLPLDVVRKVGFQMLVAARVMRLVRDARIPVYANVTAEPVRHAEEIRSLLYRQLTSPVRLRSSRQSVSPYRSPSSWIVPRVGVR